MPQISRSRFKKSLGLNFATMKQKQYLELSENIYENLVWTEEGLGKGGCLLPPPDGAGQVT